MKDQIRAIFRGHEIDIRVFDNIVRITIKNDYQFKLAQIEDLSKLLGSEDINFSFENAYDYSEITPGHNGEFTIEVLNVKS